MEQVISVAVGVQRFPVEELMFSQRSFGLYMHGRKILRVNCYVVVQVCMHVYVCQVGYAAE